MSVSGGDPGTVRSAHQRGAGLGRVLPMLPDAGQGTPEQEELLLRGRSIIIIGGGGGGEEDRRTGGCSDPERRLRAGGTPGL